MTFEVQDGCFCYPRSRQQVLRNICLRIESGRVLSVLGSNGVGKTTLLRCMMGLLKWGSGVTLLDGIPLCQIPSRQLWQKIAYVPQAKSSVFSYTAKEMVTLGRSAHLSLFEQPGAKDHGLALSCMESVGILHLKDKKCNEMSGGELQMVLISRALTADPAMLVLDEPESNLDFRNQLTVLNCIKNLSRERGISVVINTHYPDHALQIADEALILNRDGSSIYGSSGAVINEKNLHRAFSVQVRIRSVEVDNQDYRCVIPVG
ncbi:MAG TPA: ABC transporter ATP-binding protein [Clostridia bacterium]|nr:ABC transporter ATP-binding protein [Clostridia bacterium]